MSYDSKRTNLDYKKISTKSSLLKNTKPLSSDVTLLDIITICTGTKLRPHSSEIQSVKSNEPAQGKGSDDNKDKTIDLSDIKTQDSNFYITLENDITTFIPNVSVKIEGVSFNVVDTYETTRDPKECLYFVAPVGTKYRINDSTKDPVGLVHLLEVEQRFDIKPNSTVYLHKGTVLELNTTEKNKPLMKLLYGIECTV